jgi:putative oxidoreductase
MKTKILFILSLLVGLVFINAGLNKFFNYLPPPDDLPEEQVAMFMALVRIGWVLPLVAIVEIMGGILFIIPRLRALGAVILCPILIGILMANITVAPEGLPMALIIWGVWLWVCIENRTKLLMLINP